MSTRVETLQAPRANGSILIGAFLATLVILTIAVVAISFDSDQGRQGETTFVGRHVVSTPSELSAGIVGGAEQTFVGGTAANTPSELNAGARLELGIKTHQFISDTLGTNTPTELSGGIIRDGLPAKFYDRHQRG
jgi:hypothetical protein